MPLAPLTKGRDLLGEMGSPGPANPALLGMNNMAMMSQMSLAPQNQHPGMGNRQSSLPMMQRMPGMPGVPMMQGLPMQMQMQMGQGFMEQPMNPQQRNNIEGWMKGIR